MKTKTQKTYKVENNAIRLQLFKLDYNYLNRVESYTNFEISQCCKFCKTTDKFGILSNFYNIPIIANGYKFKNSEALYQALKFPNYPELQERIRTAKTALESKNIARYYVEFVSKNWDDYKIDVMFYVLKLKTVCNFEKILNVFNILEFIEPKEIVELSFKNDNFWGVTTYSCNGLSGYKGCNVLGKLWMLIRENFKDLQNLKVETPENCKLFLMGHKL